jgi:hypothetical protein
MGFAVPTRVEIVRPVGRHDRQRASAKVRTMVASARDKAPEGPGLWSKVGDALADVADGAASLAGDVVNAAGSFANAMGQYPEDVAAAIAGVGLMAFGASGEVLGAALDATGVGAVGGVPLNIASAAVIATGAGVTATAGSWPPSPTELRGTMCKKSERLRTVWSTGSLR